MLRVVGQASGGAFVSPINVPDDDDHDDDEGDDYDDTTTSTRWRQGPRATKRQSEASPKPPAPSSMLERMLEGTSRKRKAARRITTKTWTKTTMTTTTDDGNDNGHGAFDPASGVFFAAGNERPATKNT